MRHHIFMIASLLAIFTNAIAQSFTNPIYDLADPFLTYYNGHYYATGTTGSTVGIKRAETIQGLKGAPTKTIFSPSSNTDAPRYAYWAPEIHRINGKWYCYFTANDKGDDVYQSCYVLQTNDDDPFDANWEYAGRIYDPAADYYFIDATILQLGNELYMVYCGCEPDHVNHFPQRLYINKMESPTKLVSGRTLLSTPTLSWEGNGVNEGPEVIVHDDKVWLAYSTSGCWTADYKLGLMEFSIGNDPLDASKWIKHSNPVFVGDAAARVYAPGHHCFFKSPDGTEDWFAYHATPEAGGACDASRTVRAQRLYWNADGSPNFGTIIAGGMFLTSPSGEISTSAGNVANGVYEIECRATGKVLDLANGDHYLNTNIQQYTSNGSDAQRWAIQCHTDGYYTITAVAGGLSMDVKNASHDNAANIETYAPNGGNAQKWSFESVGDGYYKIISRESGKVMDINTSTNNLQQYDYLGGENQQFKLRLIGTAPHPEEPFVTIESYNMHSNFIRHSYGNGRIDKYISGIDDAYWKIVPGLSGTGISFQSKNYPSNYLRVNNQQLYLNENDNSAAFAADATFNIVDGLANKKHISFNLLSDPSKYIRHRDGILYCEQVNNNIGYNDATWILMRPEFDHSADVATLYTDANMQGMRYGVPEGDYNEADLYVRGIEKSAISSLQIIPGYKATLYEGGRFNNYSQTYTESTTYVGNSINDKTNSVSIKPNGTSGLDGTWKIEAHNSKMFWDMDGNGSTNGTHIVQWNDEGDEQYQHWILKELENGVYQIHNVGSTDKVVEVANGSKENRTALQINTNKNDKSQQFILYNVADDWYQFIARNSGKIAELPNNSFEAGSQITLWENVGQNCSYWRLIDDKKTEIEPTKDNTKELIAWPNPTRDIINILGADTNIITLYDTMGRIIKRYIEDNTETTHTIDLSNLSPAIYILHCGSETIRIIKE